MLALAANLWKEYYHLFIIILFSLLLMYLLPVPVSVIDENVSEKPVSNLPNALVALQVVERKNEAGVSVPTSTKCFKLSLIVKTEEAQGLDYAVKQAKALKALTNLVSGIESMKVILIQMQTIDKNGRLIFVDSKTFK